MMVKVLTLSADPLGVVTVILPDVAPAGTTVVISVAETTVKSVAGVPPNFTLVVPVSFVPLMVTTVPASPLSGVKLVIVGRRVKRRMARPPSLSAT